MRGIDAAAVLALSGLDPATVAALLPAAEEGIIMGLPDPDAEE